ncbi:MAG: DUF389 domain-containing protein [Chromatiales bacterium]|nr:DUF389 domain-containing protein [Chromatiales bacterium]
MSAESPPPSGGLRGFMGFLIAHGQAPRVALEAEAVLQQRQVANSALSLRFALVLSLACMIATLGLMADSPVTVIGAMLIAPLMKPIVAFAYGAVTGNSRLMLRAFITVAVGIAITLLVAAGTEAAFDLRGLTSEILARTQPSLIDLGVAVAAAIAATLAATRPDVAETLPGVAVAVALVPPLCVSGIGLSTQQWSVASGAFILFAVNLAAIMFCAGIVFLIDGYGKSTRAVPGMLGISVLLAVLAPSLFASMKRLHVDDVAQDTVEHFLHELYPVNQTVHPDDLRRVDAVLFADHVFVFVELEAPDNAFSALQLRTLYERVSADLDKPVNLKLQFIRTDEMTIYPFKPATGDLPLYGADNPVPRR